jgi:hypothetical protein
MRQNKPDFRREKSVGIYFLMSHRGNKNTPEDFGLLAGGNPATAIHPANGSVWTRHPLYDFGWGRETGYYRTPLPGYKKLLELVLSGNDREDRYGAAAMILEQHPEELLETCRLLVFSQGGEGEQRLLAEIFHLERGNNYCPVVGKTYAEILETSNQWLQIAEVAKALSAQKKPKWRLF